MPLHEAGVQSVRILRVLAVTLGFLPLAPHAYTQEPSLKDRLVGSWIYVSSQAKRDDGSTLPRPPLQGVATYTSDGRFHFITTRTDTPKLASNDTTAPTAEEAMAIASGSIAYTGTYTLDEATRTLTLSIETSTFPNLVGLPTSVAW
ncbi:MAG: hypothetical protein EKK41_23875 [Hyphomicrobiales bacterium]|nr:MAG: hypothetical protein EKK41_23875 [Hyphomicrobiales bacterium]